MFGGMVDVDELLPDGDAWLRRKVNQEETLIKFTNPFIVQNKFGKKPPVKAAPKVVKEFVKGSILLADTSCERQGVLDLISPPRVWEENNETWMQQVSPQPTHRCEIQILREKLDQFLEQSCARDFGICPKRIAIYGEAFDELIRQVTITCAERGIMLLKVREEMKMTFSAYKIMFEDSLVYCDKLIVPKESALVPLLEEKEQLIKDIEEAKDEFEGLSNSYEITQRRIAEARHIEYTNFKDQMKSMKRAIIQLQKLIFLLNKPEQKPGPKLVTQELIIPVSEEKELLKEHEEMKQKEKNQRREKARAYKIQRIKKMNEKMKKQFEKDMLALTGIQRGQRSLAHSETEYENYFEE